MIETGLCAHSSPTADVSANMMPQRGVSLDLIGRCQNLVMAGNRIRRDKSRLRGRKTWGLGQTGERIEGLLDDRACSGAVASRSNTVPVPYS